MIFGTYKDPDGLKRTFVILTVVVVMLALAVLAIGFVPGFASILLMFCAVATAGTLVLFKLFE